MGTRLVPPYAPPSSRLWATLGLSDGLARGVTRWSGWLGPLLVTLIAGLMRFWHLGSPKAVIFDETYYAKDAWALIHRGFEVNWDKNANDLILKTGGHVPLPHDAAYVVHPPVGKYVIGIGEWLFGFDPFGWRFMTAVLGTLCVFLVCRIGRRLFRSTFLGCLAGLLLAVDGLAFVMSRTALLDSVLVFFVVAAFGCLVVDRDKARGKLAAALPRGEDGVPRPDVHIAETLRLGWRPWRLLAGLCLGLAAGTKWNGFIYLAAFGVLTVLWDVGARRVAGAGRPYVTVLKRDLGWAFLSTVPVAVATYVLSWLGWILSPADGTGGYFRNWAATDGRGGSWTWLFPDWVRSLWHYEHEVYKFNVGLSSPHIYQSNPWSWLVDGRPVSYFYESPLPGKDGCPAGAGDKCAREVLGARHPAAVVGGGVRRALCAVALVLPPRLAGGRHRVRRRRGLPALVQLPGTHDLLLLRGRLRALPLSRRRDAGRRDPGATGVRGAAQSRGRGRRRRTRPADRVELRLLLADLHRPGDPLQLLAVPDVAGFLGLTSDDPAPRKRSPFGQVRTTSAHSRHTGHGRRLKFPTGTWGGDAACARGPRRL